MAWKYEQPVEIIFGRGSIRKLPQVLRQIGKTKGILITGQHLIKNGEAQEIRELCKETVTAQFAGVSPNPTVEEVELATELAKVHEADFILAVGGGSVLDCAKAVSVAAKTEKLFSECYHTGEFPKNHIPVIAVPTTAGTGSEVTSVAVISNPKTGEKKPVSGKMFYPVVALLDPAYTDSMPKKVIAETGIDALAHALEAFWSIHHQPVCDMFAVRAMKGILAWLEKSYFEPENKEAKDQMLEASLMAGLAFNLPKTTVCHACSFPLTSKYGLSHGEAVGMTLDYFLRINAGGKDGFRLENLSKELGFQNADEFADKIADIKKKLNLRTNLAEFHLSESEKHELAAASQHPNLLGNPVAVTEEMLYQLYDTLAEPKCFS